MPDQVETPTIDPPSAIVLGLAEAWWVANACEGVDRNVHDAAEVVTRMSEPTESPVRPDGRVGLLTYDTETGAATYINGGTAVSLGCHLTLFSAYAAAREDGHRPLRWTTRIGGVPLRLDQADHWDRMFDARRRGSRS